MCPSKQAATTVSVPEDLRFFDQLGLGRAEGLLRTQVWGGINHQSEGDVRWRLTDGEALLTTDEKGRGRVALISTSLDRDLSDLAIRPGFVPLLRGLLRWLAGQSAGGLDPDLRRGERFSQTLGAQEVQWVGPEKARARTIVEAGQLRFTPPRLGLWRAKEIELGVELRTDERESRPLSQTQRQALAGSGGVGDQGLPLWPLPLDPRHARFVCRKLADCPRGESGWPLSSIKLRRINTVDSRINEIKTSSSQNSLCAGECGRSRTTNITRNRGFHSATRSRNLGGERTRFRQSNQGLVRFFDSVPTSTHEEQIHASLDPQ